MSDDADLMTDIEVLKAVEEIRQLEARYARYADEKRWADLAGLFTVDGTFTPQDAGGKPIAVMSGRQEIADSLTAVTAGVTPDPHAAHVGDRDPVPGDRARDLGDGRPDPPQREQHVPGAVHYRGPGEDLADLTRRLKAPAPLNREECDRSWMLSSV
jgi:hypothetical protein